MAQQRANSGGGSSSALIGAAVVAGVLQLALAPQISVFGGAFNFMVVLAVAWAASAEPAQAVYAGFFCGLFYDLTSSAPVGLMALLLTVASYVVAHASAGLTPGANLETLRISCAAILAVNLVNGAALLALGSETSILYALGVHALVSAALDIAASVPFLVVIGAHAQSGVFSGRGARRATYATPSRAGATKRSGSKRARGASGGYTLGKRAGKHSSGRASGKRSGGLRFK